MSVSVTDHELVSTTLDIASRLPLVYKNNLITLINEVIQKQPACQTIVDNVPFYAPDQTIQYTLRLLFSSHYCDSPATFFLLCLSALGWADKTSEWEKTGDIVDPQLKSESGVTLSLAAASSSWHRVLEEANEIQKKIMGDLALIGTEIDMSLCGFPLKLVRLLLGSLLLSSHVSENSQFYEMFDNLLTTTKSPSETASLIYSILSHFHYNEDAVFKLGPYLIPGFSLHVSYPEIYFKLRIVEFLCSLGKDKCKIAMMAFYHIHLNDKLIHKYMSSPLEFVRALFDRCEADITKLNELAGYFNQPNYFSMCKQKQNETDLSITPDSGSTPLMQNEPFDEVSMTFMIHHCRLEEDDFMKLDEFMSSLSSPLENDLAQGFLSPPISDIVVEKFLVYLHPTNKNFRPFSKKEQIALQLAIQGLVINVKSESFFSAGILTPPLVYVLLDRLGYPMNELVCPPTEEVMSVYLEYPDFDMLLTIATIIRFMSYQECKMFKEVIPSSDLPIFETSIISICYTLTRRYKSDNLDMNQVLKWLQVSKCFDSYGKYITEYFERYDKREAKHKVLQKGMIGNISLNYIKIVICGPPCVGKTAFKDLLAKKPPLKKHHSTPIARPIHAIERIAAGGKVWEEITDKDLLLMLSNIIRDYTKVTDPILELDAVPDATQSSSFTETAPVVTTTIAALPLIPKAFSSTPLLIPQKGPTIEASISSPLLQVAPLLPIIATAEQTFYSASSPAVLQSTTTITSPPMLPTTERSYSVSSPVLQIAPLAALHSSIEEFTVTPSPVLQSPSAIPSPNDELPDLCEATTTTSPLTKNFDYTSRKIMEQLSSEKRERPQMLHEATWIHLLDSGGQPQFTDLLRMFVRGNSLYIIVMKVTESLHDKPTFVFSIEGKPLNAPKEMTMTNLQIIERFVRSVAATSREDNSEPAFAIVATHCDQRSKYKQFLGSEESIEMKNKTLQSHLSDFLHLFVFYNHNSDELIFPVNNLCQENREKLSADICNRLVSDVRFNINIPVRWYAFDLDIKNEASKETHGMISLESCYSIGQRLEMDKEEVERCLIYLDSMRLCIYYHKLLPHVVFTNLQFLIDCLSNIVCVSFVDKLKKILPNGTIISEKIIHLLRYNGTFDQTLLDSLGLTFIHNLFSKKDLLLLLQKFRVISSIETPQDDAKYFIPILLPAESLSEKSKNLIATNSVPLFITFDNKLMLQGLFPTLVVSLLGREEEPKFFIDSRTFEFPRQLRHAVKLYAPSLFAAVFLCENNESIDVYFTGCPQHCYHLRKVILEALSVSVKVLEYDESKLNMSALIRCNREHIERAHDKKNHPITISLDLSQIGCSVESSLPTIAISDLIERKRCWLIPTASVCEPAPLPVDDNALLNHTHAPAILDAIDSVVDEWQRLGQKLGISDKMLRQFKYNSRDQVQVCRKDMIYYWIDARCATCHKLKSALKSMGENGIVSEIQRLQTAK